MIWTSTFWRGCAERAIKTAAQTFVASVGANATGIVDVDWPGIASVTALAALLSVVTAIGNAEFTAGVPAPDPDAYGPPETGDLNDDGEPMLTDLPDPDADLDGWAEDDDSDDLEDMVAVVNEQ